MSRLAEIFLVPTRTVLSIRDLDFFVSLSKTKNKPIQEANTYFKTVLEKYKDCEKHFDKQSIKDRERTKEDKKDLL